MYITLVIDEEWIVRVRPLNGSDELIVVRFGVIDTDGHFTEHVKLYLHRAQASALAAAVPREGADAEAADAIDSTTWLQMVAYLIAMHEPQAILPERVATLAECLARPNPMDRIPAAEPRPGLVLVEPPGSIPTAEAQAPPEISVSMPRPHDDAVLFRSKGGRPRHSVFDALRDAGVDPRRGVRLAVVGPPGAIPAAETQEVV